MQTKRDAMDALIDDHRVMKSRLIRHGDPKRVTQQERCAVIEQWQDYIERTHISRNTIARSLGRSTSVVSQVLRGTYQGDWQSVILELDRLLEDELQAQESRKPTHFVSTSVARQVQAIADISVHAGGIGMAYGESGIGKTLAARAIAADKPGSIYISLDTIGTTPQSVVEELARAMRIRTVSRKSTSRFWFAALKHELRGSGRLLIVDQVHKLCGSDPKDRALFTLCDLHDGTGAPQLWLGTIDLVGYLERSEARGREPLAQIRSRIMICRDLHEHSQGGQSDDDPLFTIEEVRKVFAGNKLKLARDAERYLMTLANLRGSGSLRTAANALRMATKIYEGRAESLTAEHLFAARRLLATRRVIQQTQDQIDLENNGAGVSLTKAG